MNDGATDPGKASRREKAQWVSGFFLPWLAGFAVVAAAELLYARQGGTRYQLDSLVYGVLAGIGLAIAITIAVPIAFWNRKRFLARGVLAGFFVMPVVAIVLFALFEALLAFLDRLHFHR